MGDPLREEIGRLSSNVSKIVSFWNRDIEWKTAIERELGDIRVKQAEITAKLTERERWEDRTPLPKTKDETRAIRARVKGDWLKFWSVIILAGFTLMGTVVSVYAAVKVAVISAEAKERRSP